MSIGPLLALFTILIEEEEANKQEVCDGMINFCAGV